MFPSRIRRATRISPSSPSPNERTSLLIRTDDENVVSVDDKPLPMLQVILLCAGRMAEGIAFFNIFPYISKMIHESAGVPTDEVGFWAGLIESMFSPTQMIVMLFWGRAADRFGRRPVFIFCLVGMAVSTSLFGLARNVWEMIAIRALAGVFAGTVVTIRTMLSENSTPLTQARAFSLFTFASNLSQFMGPLLGGALAEPAQNYPKLFGNIRLFVDYPYLLPGLVAGGLGLLGAFANLIWLKETLPEQTSLNVKQDPPSLKSIVASPGVKSALAIYLYATLLAFLYTALMPVFYWTPVKLGGLGLSPPQSSLLLAGVGISQSIWLLLVFPPLQRRVGTGAVLQRCAVAWPLSLALMPLLYALRRTDQDRLFLALTLTTLAGPCGVALAFGGAGVQLVLNDASPSSIAFGTINGLALSLQSAIRAISPTAITSLYAFGVSRQILHGQLIWLVVIPLAMGFRLTLAGLPTKSTLAPMMLQQEREREGDDDV